jgi:hypothetical protein
MRREQETGSSLPARHRRRGQQSAERGAASAQPSLCRSRLARELVVAVVVDPPVTQIRVLQALHGVSA